LSFRVTNRATGSSFSVDPDETVLAAARRQGVELPWSCLNGTCTACKAGVIDGEVDYPRLPPQGLDEGEKEKGLALLCQAVPRSDLTIVARELQALKEIRTRQVRVEVADIAFPAENVALLHLQLPRGTLDYLAGQHLEVLLPDGRRRAFSIANAPNRERQLELHVRHVPGGGFTDLVFASLKPGDELEIEVPLGAFYLRDKSPRPMICVAGGTGFSPIKAIIEETLLEGSVRPLYLYWGANGIKDLYQHALCKQWAEQHQHIHFIPVLSGKNVEDWQGRRGFVHQAVIADFPNLKPFDVYMSGPPMLIDAGRHEFVAHGLPEHHLYFDSFEFAPDILAKMHHIDD
jgi:CDP-4-dehydro-6-deoxyglucose reductase